MARPIAANPTDKHGILRLVSVCRISLGSYRNKAISDMELMEMGGHREPACSVPRQLVELVDIGGGSPPDGGVFIAILP